ncbi:hypothetical protein EMPS_04174 [Entomortierella parvispora]|uniref:Uncharacterized protein n=1 Tax=Entomortierella parvispora TaxID=205924 RepID=A0A9P3H870_9FUNG|nr:hypothetical protein EMPS_04174 [Entomortierella parvispora]
MTTRLLSTSGGGSNSNSNRSGTSADSLLSRPTYSPSLTPSTAAASSPSIMKTGAKARLSNSQDEHERENWSKRPPRADRHGDGDGNEEEFIDQNDDNNDNQAANSDHGSPAIDSWDDAFDLGPARSLRHLLGQLHRQCASSTSSLSSTSEPESSLSTSSSSSPHASLPVPTASAAQTTTTTTTEPILSTKEASPVPSALFPHRVRSTGRKAPMKINQQQRTVPATSSTFPHIDPPAAQVRLGKVTPTLNHSLPPIPPTITPTADPTSLTRPTGEDILRLTGPTNTQLLQPQLPSLNEASPCSSAASSPRAITASVTAPSTTTVTSTGSPTHKDGDKNDEDNPTLSQKAMTTITQEMMLSNLPAYSGIITRMNPFTRVAAWVDDLDDLQVPEEDLRFSHVRSALAKSSSVPDTLGSIENWDTESEGSGYAGESHCTEVQQLQRHLPSTAPFGSLEGLEGLKYRTDKKAGRTSTLPGSYTIETLDDDFEFADDFGSLQLNMQSRQYRRASSGAEGLGLSRKQSSLLQWQDSGSDIDDLDFGTPLDNHSQTSSTSSRDSSTEDENLLDGIIFPEEMGTLKLVTTHPYRPDMEPSIFGKESHIHDELDDFWDGLDVDDPGVFRRQGRNKNLVERVQIMGRERSGSRVHRQVVPLKDFVAQPSRIPRLCRSPGDGSRPITPAQSLSRKHSTHIDIPLRNVSSKSSLPRPNRTSIPRRESVRTAITTSASDEAVSSRNTSPLPTPLVSRSSTPTVLQLSPSRRNSLLGNKDDFPSFKSSSLAMRTVSFTEPTETSSSQNNPDGVKLPSPPRGAKSFASLRTLVKKLDLGRPRLPSRGLIPVFETLNTRAEPGSSTELSLTPEVEQNSDSKPLPARPTSSRSSSSTDWGSLVDSTENSKESRPSSRVGIPLGNISEISTADLEDAHSTAPSIDKLPRLFFLKRSPKNSMFSDGSELERFDNLPVPSDSRAPQTTAQDNRRQSMDRVAAWLRKPQSIPNFKETIAPVVEQQGPPPGSSIVRKSKSIRKSLFDIFGQNSEQSKEKRKKQKAVVGPKLIRNLSELKARQVAGMVYNPNGKMWDGNDDALDHFEEEDEEVGAVTRKDQSIFENSGLSPAHSNFGFTPFPNTNRPALITNLSQNSKQRTQVAGKMVFDPARMCWVINPEYLARRRHKHNTPLNEAWGDEPDVFAGLTDDSDRSEVEEDNNEVDEEGRAAVSEHVPLEEELQEQCDREGEAMAGSSLSKAKGQRLVGRPSIQRYSSHDLLSEEERLGPWAEIARPPSSLVNDTAESRPGSMGLHSIVSKSSRKSLSGIHGGSMVPIGGGGYSSRGEFEVGVEFDVTTSFLEQCIATEAQHRMDAGKFFALPYGPIDSTGELSKAAVAECTHADVAASSSLLSRMTLKKKRSSLKQLMKAGMVQANPAASAPLTPSAEAPSATSWFPWNGKSKSMREQTHAPASNVPPRNDHDKAEVLTTTTTSLLETEMNGCGTKSKSKAAKRRQSKHSSMGASTLLNLSWQRPASTESWTPAHMTVASRGKKGLFHRGRPAVRKESPWGPPHPKGDSLSYSAANLALSHREKFATYSALSFSHERRRRIGDFTFEPLKNLDYIDSVRSRTTGKWNACKNTLLDLDHLDHLEEEEIERGYRIMSTAYGRPPQRPRLDLLFELELHSGPRFRSK